MLNFSFRLLTILTLLGLGSCNNVLRDFTDKTHNDYKLDSGRKYIDEEKFDDAIAILQPLWERNQQDSEIAYYTAVAYAGRAGLKVIDLVYDLIDDLDTKGVFQIFAEFFAGANADDENDIETALNIIETVSTYPAGRNAKLNFLALFVVYSRIGVVLSRYSLSGTTLRANFTACHTAIDFEGATTGLTNSSVDKVYSSIGRIIELISYVALGADFDDILTLPAGVSALTRNGTCVATPGSAECLALRTVINIGKSDSGIGLGVSPGVPAGYTCAALTP